MERRRRGDIVKIEGSDTRPGVPGVYLDGKWHPTGPAKLYTYADCPECNRRFDLTNVIDASEWFYGHDCEEPEPEPDPEPLCDHCGEPVDAGDGVVTPGNHFVFCGSFYGNGCENLPGPARLIAGYDSDEPEPDPDAWQKARLEDAEL